MLRTVVQVTYQPVFWCCLTGRFNLRASKKLGTIKHLHLHLVHPTFLQSSIPSSEMGRPTILFKGREHLPPHETPPPGCSPRRQHMRCQHHHLWHTCRCWKLAALSLLADVLLNVLKWLSVELGILHLYLKKRSFYFYLTWKSNVICFLVALLLFQISHEFLGQYLYKQYSVITNNIHWIRI